MKRTIGILLVIFVVSLFAQSKPIKYVGSLKCKTCHRKVEDGEQYAKWELGPHAHSYETLLSAESKKIASEMGLSTSPEKSPECLRCHVSGWGEDGGYSLEFEVDNPRALKAHDDLARVGCESCHGPGNAYKSKKVMMQIHGGEIDGRDLGYVHIDESACSSCHNPESPTYKPFDFAVRVKEINHYIPEG